jgi:hypothetical protein
VNLELWSVDVNTASTGNYTDNFESEGTAREKGAGASMGSYPTCYHAGLPVRVETLGGFDFGMHSNVLSLSWGNYGRVALCFGAGIKMALDERHCDNTKFYEVIGERISDGLSTGQNVALCNQ